MVFTLASIALVVALVSLHLIIVFLSSDSIVSLYPLTILSLMSIGLEFKFERPCGLEILSLSAVVHHDICAPVFVF